MNESARCAGCGSADIVLGAKLQDLSLVPGMLKVSVDAEPKAVLPVGRVFSRLRANICGNCGLAEIFAEDPSELYQAYLESLQNQPRDPSEYGASPSSADPFSCLECGAIIPRDDNKCPSCGWTYVKP